MKSPGKQKRKVRRAEMRRAWAAALRAKRVMIPCFVCPCTNEARYYVMGVGSWCEEHTPASFYAKFLPHLTEAPTDA